MQNKKNTALGSFLLVSFMLCGSFIISAQEKQTQAQRFIFWDEIVKPSMVTEYEAGVKKQVALFSKYKSQYPWNAYSTNDFHYYYVTPVENSADIDKVSDAFDAMEKNMGKEQSQAMRKNFEGTLESHDKGMVRHLPELSYIPENPRVKADEINFIYWGFCYLKFGKEKQFGDNFKKWVNLYKRNNIADGWDTYVLEMGRDLPLYVWSSVGKNAADFWSMSEKHNEALGDEANALWNETLSLLRKFEYKTGMPRPELSLQAAEELTAK